MKKNILCVFGLILWALIICTILSAKIEVLMTAEVATYKPTNFIQPVILPMDVLFYDGDRLCVYAVTTGAGWESGKRVVELSSQDFSVDDQRNYMSTAFYYEAYILYSSKPLRSGDLIKPQGTTNLTDDSYLILYSDGVPPLKSSHRGLMIQAQDHNTLLVSVEQVQQPFMEKQVKNRVATLEDLTEYDGAIELDGAKKEIFSLSDVDVFLKNLPLLAVLLDTILIPCILWIYSCFLIQNVKKNRKYLLANAIMSILFTFGTPLVMSSIHLPSSLLPRTHIFEWAHYSEEFSQIFDALNGLPSLPNAVQAQIVVAHQRILAFVGLLVSGVFFAVIIVVIEYYKVRRNKQYM